MIKRFLALLCCLLLAASVAQAAIDWPVLTTQGQQAAQTYIAQVNANLSSLGAANINSLFECYPVIMSLGITAQDNADTPEGVELSLQLQEEGMVSLTVRSIYPDSFGAGGKLHSGGRPVQNPGGYRERGRGKSRYGPAKSRRFL